MAWQNLDDVNSKKDKRMRIFSLTIVTVLIFSISAQSQIYVDKAATGANNGSSWADAYTDLHDALDNSVSGIGANDEIWIAGGIYKPDPVTGIAATTVQQGKAYTFPMISGIKVYGSFNGESAPNLRSTSNVPTVISGDIGIQNDATDNSNILFHLLGSNTLLDGIHFEKSYTLGHGGAVRGVNGVTVEDCDFFQCIATEGGAMRLGGYLGTGSTTVRNSLFKENKANDPNSLGGGAILCFHQIALENCEFINNSAYPPSANSTSHKPCGGAIHSQSSIDISSCTFNGNSAFLHGGAVYSIVEANIQNSNFINNSAALYAGALEVGLSTTPSTIENCLFKDNSAQLTGALIVTNGNVINCAFSGNSSNTFLFYSLQSTLRLIEANAINCSFSENSMSSHGAFPKGVISIERNSTSSINGNVRNCAIWGNNNHSSIVSSSSGVGNVSNCIIEGGFSTGTSIINSDPKFVSDELHLASSSPAIDAGDNAIISSLLVTTDILGKDRIDVSGIVDIGAYEMQCDRTLRSKLGKDQVICGASIVLSPEITGGGATQTFSWSSDPVGTTATTKSITVNPSVETTYTLVTNDASTCADIDDVTVYPDIASAHQVTTPITACGSFNLEDAHNHLEDVTYTYTLSGSAVTNPVTQSGTYTIKAEKGSCSSSKTVVVTINSGAFTVCHIEDAAPCEGGSTAYTCSQTGSGFTYQWQSDFGTGSFVDLADETSPSLGLTNVPFSWNGFQYRVKVTNGSCIQYSNAAYLNVSTFMEVWETHAAMASHSEPIEKGDYYGNAVDIDGDLMVVTSCEDRDDELGLNRVHDGSPDEFGPGSAFIYNAVTQSFIQKIIPWDRVSTGMQSMFGVSVSVSKQSQQIVVGDHAREESGFPRAGAVYVYKYVSSSWLPDAKLLPDPIDREFDANFGVSVAIEGNLIVVGAPGHNNGDGRIYIFEKIAGTWSSSYYFVDPTFASGRFGSSVAISGTTILVGAPEENGGEGRAYVLTPNGFGTPGWSISQTLNGTSPNRSGDKFGNSVAILNNTAVIGAFHDADLRNGQTQTKNGSMEIYQLTSGTWSFVKRVTPEISESGKQFGRSVAMSQAFIAVSSFGSSLDYNGQNPVWASGGLHVYTNGKFYEKKLTLLTANRAYADYLGNSVAITNDHVLGGAPNYHMGSIPAVGRANLFAYCSTLTPGSRTPFEDHENTDSKPTQALQTERFGDNSIELYPNPASSSIYLTGLKTASSKISVYDVMGKKVLEGTAETKTEYPVDVSGLTNGVYFLHVIQNGEATTIKWFKE